MPVRKLIVKLITGNLLPDSIVVLDVAGASFIGIDLADIVEQGYNRRRLFVRVQPVGLFNPRPCKVIKQAFIYVQAVSNQAPVIGTVETGAGGRRKEVAGFGIQILQKLVRSFSFDFILVEFYKLIPHLRLNLPFQYTETFRKQLFLLKPTDTPVRAYINSQCHEAGHRLLLHQKKYTDEPSPPANTGGRF